MVLPAGNDGSSRPYTYDDPAGWLGSATLLYQTAREKSVFGGGCWSSVIVSQLTQTGAGSGQPARSSAFTLSQYGLLTCTVKPPSLTEFSILAPSLCRSNT